MAPGNTAAPGEPDPMDSSQLLCMLQAGGFWEQLIDWPGLLELQDSSDGGGAWPRMQESWALRSQLSPLQAFWDPFLSL